MSPFNPAPAQTGIDLFFALGICGTCEESRSTCFPSKLRRREFFVYFFAEKKVNATARHEGRQACAEKALGYFRQN